MPEGVGTGPQRVRTDRACSYSKQHVLEMWALCHSVFVQ